METRGDRSSLGKGASCESQVIVKITTAVAIPRAPPNDPRVEETRPAERTTPLALGEKEYFVNERKGRGEATHNTQLVKISDWSHT